VCVCVCVLSCSHRLSFCLGVCSHTFASSSISPSLINLTIVLQLLAVCVGCAAQFRDLVFDITFEENKTFLWYMLVIYSLLQGAVAVLASLTHQSTIVTVKNGSYPYLRHGTHACGRMCVCV
jgi:hypothetical protein